MGSALGLSTFAAQNSNIANDGSADSPRGFGSVTTTGTFTMTAIGPSLYRVVVSSPAAPITAALPTTVKAGYRCRIEVELTSSTETNCFFTSPAIAEAQINGTGFVELMAKVDNPSVAGDWKVVDVEEIYGGGALTLSPLTGAYLGGTASVLRFVRRKKIATVTFSAGAQAAAAANISATTVALPTRITPSTAEYLVGINLNITTPISVNIGTNGIITVSKVDNSNFSGNSRFLSYAGVVTYTYSL
jgi:hypothetical protein